MIGAGTLVGGVIVVNILDRKYKLDQCVQKNLQVLNKIVGGRPLTDYEKHTVQYPCEQELNK